MCLCACARKVCDLYRIDAKACCRAAVPGDTIPVKYGTRIARHSTECTHQIIPYAAFRSLVSVGRSPGECWCTSWLPRRKNRSPLPAPPGPRVPTSAAVHRGRSIVHAGMFTKAPCSSEEKALPCSDGLPYQFSLSGLSGLSPFSPRSLSLSLSLSLSAPFSSAVPARPLSSS